jgi:hypothetical protein
MAILDIPTRSDLDRYSLAAAIEGTEYRMVFSYNTRDEYWYLSIELTDGTPLVSGRPLVADTPLLNRWVNDELPEDGFLMAVDSTGDGEEAVKEDLGDRIRLVWVPLEDI